jgi:3-deoxy-7-phosphoheptulonate synthase
LLAAGLRPNIMIDCSHANSAKDPARQVTVARDVATQIKAGNLSIMGLMIESNICGGSQKLTKDLSKLAYGVSITDPCIAWNTTTDLLRELARDLSDVLRQRPRLGARASAA